MSEAVKMMSNLVAMEIENNSHSKINGRRNWVIRTEIYDGEKCVVFHGAFGEGERRGWLAPESLKNIEKYSIRWYKYTYKKDYLKALEELKNDGYKVW